MNRICLLPAAFLVIACSGGSPVGPDMPDARGTFEGTWSFSFTIVGTSETFNVPCAGRLEILSQSGERLTGGFNLDEAG